MHIELSKTNRDFIFIKLHPDHFHQYTLAYERKFNHIDNYTVQYYYRH